MARIWLDATVDEQDSSLSTRRRPPVPSIPEAEEHPSSPVHDTAALSPSIPTRRRRSMPPRPLSHITVASSSQDTSAKRKSTASRRSQLRNPDEDVITSLVASLAHEPLGSTPYTNPVTVNILQPPALRKVASQDSGFIDTRVRNGKDITFDDAAVPPVIKTAPPPSGFSPITAPKTKSSPIKSSFFRVGSQRGSRTSLISQLSAEDARSGPLSVDSVAAGLTIVDDEILAVDIPRTDARHRSPIIKSSHERLKELAAEHKRASKDIDHDNVKYLYPPSPVADRVSSRKKHDSSIDDPEVAFSKFDSVPGFRSMGKRAVKDPDMPTDVSPAVPKRQSSLARTEASSASSKAKRTTKSAAVSSRSTSNQSAGTKGTKTDITSGRPSEDLKFEDVEDIDTDVVKRIKELKARRELRAAESDNLMPPTLHLSQLGHTTPESSRSRSPSARHVRSASDPERDEKYLAVQPLGLHKTSSTNDLHARSNASDIGWPVTPNTPSGSNTPLPIDYGYVLQALENEPISRSQSTNPPSERQAQYSDKGDTNGSQAPELQFDGRAPARVSSDEPTPYQPRRFEDFLPESSPSTKLKKKKKRWSQSDIEFVDGHKSHKNSDSFAVRPPDLPTRLSEERPSTSDSVDADVSQFVHAGRLTQKIRHPQNGRTIAFSEVGDPTGHAVFCCVGMGLTRYITAFYDELAKTLKLRLITPDRPGVGGTQGDPNGTPLSWPDDIIAICQVLYITKFSVMAHSAGAVYALATALRVPQHIRGKVHLLAPWIPPSQMTMIGLKEGSAPTTQLPKSQRLLRALPTPFLKVANSGFMTATSASLSPNNSPRQRKRNNYKQAGQDKPTSSHGHSRNDSGSRHDRPNMAHVRRESFMLMDQNDMPSETALSLQHKAVTEATDPELLAAMTLAEQERRKEYDSRLTLAIWDLATTNANPAVDLLVCLERTQPIGFRYVDINRSVVIHHGSKDTRVPVENVKWLGRTMRKCEVRILEGEGHGLMASAAVMGGVLTEMAQEWAEWSKHTAQKGYERRERRDLMVGGGSPSLGVTTVS